MVIFPYNCYNSTHVAILKFNENDFDCIRQQSAHWFITRLVNSICTFVSITCSKFQINIVFETHSFFPNQLVVFYVRSNNFCSIIDTSISVFTMRDNTEFKLFLIFTNTIIDPVYRCLKRILCTVIISASPIV